MKVTPVSGDMLVKVGVGLAVLGLAAYLLHRAKNVIGETLPYINPVDRDNVAYTGVNAVGGSLVTDPAGPGKNADGTWSFGAWIYDVTHGDQVGQMTTGKANF